MNLEGRRVRAGGARPRPSHDVIAIKYRYYGCLLTRSGSHFQGDSIITTIHINDNDIHNDNNIMIVICCIITISFNDYCLFTNPFMPRPAHGPPARRRRGATQPVLVILIITMCLHMDMCIFTCVYIYIYVYIHRCIIPIA